MAEKNKQFLFDNLTYDTYGEVTPSGDTLRYAITNGAKPGQLYKIEYLTKQGLSRDNSTLRTKQESGQLIPGFLTPISRTSDWGKTIDSTFYPEIMETPVTEDYSKVGKVKQLLYNFSRKYLEDGGKVQKGLLGTIIKTPDTTTNYLTLLGTGDASYRDDNSSVEYRRSGIPGNYSYNVFDYSGNKLDTLDEQTFNDGYLKSKGYWPTRDSNGNVNGISRKITAQDYNNVVARNTGNKPKPMYTVKKQGGKISDLLNNQEFLTTLQKCGGKMKKEACGGKMKKKK